MIRRLNIRWRLTFWFAAAMTVLLVGRSFWIYFMMHRRLTLITDAELDARLDALEDTLRSSPGLPELKEALAKYADNQRNLRIAIVNAGDPQDVVFSSHPQESAEQTARDPPTSRSSRQHRMRSTPDGELFREVSAAVSSPAGPLTVEISRSMEAEQSEVWDFAVTLLTTLPLIVLTAFAVGYLVSSRALTPVDKMISAANVITAKRLNQRIDVPDTGDELSRLARTLNEMIDRLYTSFEEMRRFTADAAHDLRTPVAALRTEVEVSLMADKTVEDYRHSMETVLEEAVNLSRLTAQLLDLSREDHGIHPTQQEHVRLDLVLQSVLEDLQTAAQQKKITVDTRQMRSWTVTGDPVRLRRVFMNLLNNAIHYTPPGGRVWIEGELTRDAVTLVISDNGQGIPADDLPHIFDRFRRVDRARNRQSGGTGLGLAICKAIVEAHGGQIRMESELGRGTRVFVSLPMTAPLF